MDDIFHYMNMLWNCYNGGMANMILVDYDTALNSGTYQQTKDAVIDYVVNEPETLITVLNANHTMTRSETEQNLREALFPFDSVLCNPLPSRVPNLTYKTMFAAKLQEQHEHKPVMVIDSNHQALQMWSDSGVVTVYQPEEIAA